MRKFKNIKVGDKIVWCKGKPAEATGKIAQFFISNDPEFGICFSIKWKDEKKPRGEYTFKDFKIYGGDITIAKNT